MRSISFSLFLSLLLALAACGDDSRPTDTGTPTDGGGGDADVDGGTDAGEDSGVDCSGRPTETPEPRGEVTGILDADNGRIVVFGGNTSAPVMCSPRYTMTTEMWAYHLDCDNWERIEATGPSERGRASAAYDSMRNRMIIFGGLSGDPFTGAPRLGDVWAFDLATDTWEEITTSGTGPSPRSEAAVGYDEANDRLIVSGGDPGGLNGTDDLFALDLATGTWSELDGFSGPSPRYDQGYAVAEGKLWIAGGAEDGGFDGTVDYFNDIWSYDFATDTWTEHATADEARAPAGRFGWNLYTGPEAGQLVLFGGHDPTDLGNSNDVWRYDVAGDTWTSLRPGDTLNGSPSGPCMFPADFTLPEEGMPTPERRYSGIAVSQGDTAYALFGKTDCGNINDAWALDMTSGTWELLRPPTGGEACNRTGSTTCSTLCF